MKWNLPAPEALISRLNLGQGVLKMVLDTDAYNEVDDQFALCYSLLSKERLDVQAVYAAPFFNDRAQSPADGMEKSYQEIVRLLGTMDIAPEGLVFHGSDRYLPDADTPVDSEAARDLVRRAMAMPEGETLYVAAIAAITNVASALLMEPRIAERIAVVWLGGHPLSYPHAVEFNLMQDVRAARVLFDSGVPVTLLPCSGVASHLLTTVPELTESIGGRNAMCDALIELFSAYSADHFAWAKEIWDISVIGYLINPDWLPTVLAPSPLLTDDCHWATDARRHMIRVAHMAYRNPIFRDMFEKLRNA